MKHYEYNTRLTELRTLQAVPKNERHALKLTDVTTGSFVKIDGVMHKVMDEYIYQYETEQWNEFKLMNLETEEDVFIEIEVDDGVEVYLSDKKMKMSDLGITRNDLIELVNEEEDIRYDGRTYEYEDDYEARFKRLSEQHWQTCYLYEFEGSGGRGVTIEDWDGKLEVHHSIKLSKGRIEIVSI